MSGVEQSPLLKEFKTYLQSTLVAFGSDGAPFSLVNQRFSEDWVGSPSLKEYAAKLGYVQPNGIFKLLESMPDQVTMLVNPGGDIVLKPVPMEETRDNLEKIDATNKELKAEKKRRQQGNGPLPASVIAQLAAGICWPPPIPGMPMSAVCTAQPATPLRTSVVESPLLPPPPAPPLSKKFNPNLIPLGTPRFARCASANNIAANTGGAPSISCEPSPSPIVFQPPYHQPQQQPPRFKIFYGQRKKAPTVPVARNDFGDFEAAPPQPKHSAPPASTPEASVVESHFQLPPPPPPPPTERRNDAYYEEDFRASASPRPESPEPQPVKEEAQEVVVKAEPRDTTSNSDSKMEEQPPVSLTPPKENAPSVCEEKGQIDAIEWDESDFDEADSEESSSDNDWEFLDDFMDSEHWPEEEQHNECSSFLQRFLQLYSKPVPGSIYRLVRTFRSNGGSFSRIDLLEKKYLHTYGTRLSTNERNRLLGAPATTRIAKDSFLKAAFPELFHVSERVSTGYGLTLSPCLTGSCVDPSVFLCAHSPLPSRPSTSASVKEPPTPTTPAQKPNQRLTINSFRLISPATRPELTGQAKQNFVEPPPNDDSSQLLKHFAGKKITSILSAYADLLGSLKEPPLPPPFSIGQLVLFQHDNLGLCRGRILRQDSRHLAVKHLDTSSEHYVKMDAIYAFPDQLLKDSSANSRHSYSDLASHPAIPLNVFVPIPGQQFSIYE